MQSLTLTLATTILAITAANTAFGKANIQCNKKQTKCVTESTGLTIGDKVGIFNDEGELVATGEVNAMRGERRAVLIDKRHGAIRKGYRLTMLENKAAGSDLSAVKVYREPAKLSVGFSGGLSSIVSSSGAPASELSVFGQMRQFGGLQIIARGVYMAMEGDATRYADQGTETLPMSVSGIGLLGGVGYVVRDNKLLAFRGEAAVGGMSVSAAIDGDPSLVSEDEGFKSDFSNGIGFYGRLSAGAQLNLESWHIHADVAQSFIQKANGYTIAAGVSKDLQ